jgi:hypothetical protein
MRASFQMPGTLTVTMDGGGVTRFEFTPPIEPDVTVFEFDCDADEEGIDGWDLNDVDGPFWKAVQQALAPDSRVGAHARFAHTVPIEWTE